MAIMADKLATTEWLRYHSCVPFLANRDKLRVLAHPWRSYQLALLRPLLTFKLCFKRFFRNQCDIDHSVLADLHGWQVATINHSPDSLFRKASELRKQSFCNQRAGINGCCLYILLK